LLCHGVSQMGGCKGFHSGDVKVVLVSCKKIELFHMSARSPHTEPHDQSHT
jgi:hypothetical protein